MRLKTFIVVSGLALLVIMSGCKPEEMEIEVYTSDLKSVISGDVVELPLIATFSMLGEDEEGVLSNSIAVAKKYLNEKAEFKISKGDFGNVLVIKCTVPMGNDAALATYLGKHHRPLALTVLNSKTGTEVAILKTDHFKQLSQDLSGVNMMLNFEFPAESTKFRFVGDLKEGPEIAALAVFSDNKPELIFKKTVDRRQNVEIDYRGGDASVYSEISPIFNVRF